jgi:hypothetical protein
VADVNLSVPAREFRALTEKVREAARQGLRAAAGIVQVKVIDLTPRWKGGLQSRVLIRPNSLRDEQTVHADGVVAFVHENNARWSRLPPWGAIHAWVTGKLGRSGKDADAMTAAVRWKIRKLGLTLPNKEGRGQMFRRAYEVMVRTKAHMTAFRAVFISGVKRGLVIR